MFRLFNVAFHGIMWGGVYCKCKHLFYRPFALQFTHVCPLGSFSDHKMGLQVYCEEIFWEFQSAFNSYRYLHCSFLQNRLKNNRKGVKFKSKNASNTKLFLIHSYVCQKFNEKIKIPSFQWIRRMWSNS